MTNEHTVVGLMTVYQTPIEYVKQAFDSMLDQTRKLNAFVVVVDGDDRERLSAFLRVQRDMDPRVDIIWKLNTGLTNSLNVALAHINAKYGEDGFILRQDADDVSLPHRCGRLLRHMVAHPDCGVVGDNYNHIDEYGKILHTNTADPENVEKRRYENHGLAGTVAGGGVMLRTKAVNEVHGWRYPVAQDCYMLHAMRSQGWKVQSVTDTLYQWRTHADQITQTRTDEQREIVKKILEGLG